MGDVELLVAQARAIVAKTMESATDQLLAGADVARVQRAVAAAATCLEDIEAYALLADRKAERAIQVRIAQLQQVHQSLGSPDD
jgi:hypothetical protein